MLIGNEDPFQKREAAKYENPIPSREFILEVFLSKNSAMQLFEIAEILGINEEQQFTALKHRVKAMLRDGQLEKLKSGYLWVAGTRKIITATTYYEESKLQAVVPENSRKKIYLDKGNVIEPKAKTKVKASVIVVGENMYAAKITEIIDDEQLITGRLILDGDGGGYVIAFHKDYKQEIIILDKKIAANDGDIVVVKIQRFCEKRGRALATICKVLGNEKKSGIEIEAAIHNFELPHVWNEDVLAEARKFKEVNASKLKNRDNLLDIPFVTIDGEDSKDFDDAVFCEKYKDGWRLYVAIADVGHYVKPNSAIDKEAKLRGNSVYFPGKVIPMLPEKLSNTLCSLQPNVQRFAIVCRMLINKDGNITRSTFKQAIIKSHARLTYTKVNLLLNSDNKTELEAQYKRVLPGLKSLHKLYKVLAKAKIKRGAIEFDTVDTKIIFNRHGKISTIQPVVRNVAHKIIEECMLCANQAAARLLKRYKAPALYRHHDAPNPEKAHELTRSLKALGINLRLKDPLTPECYAKIIKAFKKRDDGNVLQNLVLRSMSQAVYSSDDSFHFGLALDNYCHFTSPIRRYPDLVVHRQIKNIIDNKNIPKLTDKGAKKLDNMASHFTSTEKRADDATRDVAKWLKCLYVQKHLGEVFPGNIVGVTNFGLFVELSGLLVEGLVHITALKDDYYNFDSSLYTLTGKNSGRKFALGDKVNVLVAEVNTDERFIDLNLVAENEANKRYKRKTKKENNKEKSQAKSKKHLSKKQTNKEKSKRKPKPISKTKNHQNTRKK